MTPARWIAAFEPRTSLWWGRFLPEGFGHVFGFGFVAEAGVWVYLEATVTGSRIGVADEAQVARWFTAARMRELRLLEMAPVAHEARRPRFCVTCAGSVASLFGLRRYPLTPHGLFWTLRRLGAREIGR